MKTDCEGCRDRYVEYANIINIKGDRVKEILCNPQPKEEICPCSICLIKGMCQVQCETYSNYRGKS